MEDKKESKEFRKGGKKKFSKIEKQIFTFIAVLLLIFLVFIATYYAFKPRDSFEYGNLTIYKRNIEGVNRDFYVIPLKASDGKEIFPLSLRNDPRETENISLKLNSILFDRTTRIWVTFDPSMPSDAIIASSELLNLAKGIGIYAEGAMTNTTSVGGKENYPEITCNDASVPIRVIELRLGNSTRVYSEASCIVIEGKNEEEMVQAAERLIVTWLERALKK